MQWWRYNRTVQAGPPGRYKALGLTTNMADHAKGTPAFYDLVLDAKNLKDDAMRLFAEIRPSWKIDDLEVEVGELEYRHVKSLQPIWRSGTRRWYIRVPNLQMSRSDLARMQGYQDDIAAMVASGHDPLPTDHNCTTLHDDKRS